MKTSCYVVCTLESGGKRCCLKSRWNLYDSRYYSSLVNDVVVDVWEK